MRVVSDDKSLRGKFESPKSSQGSHGVHPDKKELARNMMGLMEYLRFPEILGPTKFTRGDFSDFSGI